MKNFTDTSEGIIHHLRIGELCAPVKLEVFKRGMLRQGNNGKPIPLRKGGRLVYALPNGGEYIE